MATESTPESFARHSLAHVPESQTVLVVSAFLAIPALFAVLKVLAHFDLDLRVQDLVFDFASCQWLVARNAPIPKILLYTGPKVLFALAAAMMIVVLLWPSRYLGVLPTLLRDRNRRKIGFVLASMILLPGIVAVLKHTSWVPCPYDVDRYCGDLAPLSPFERAPTRTALLPERGGCFPAAHASGAFSLMALYFVGTTRRRRLLLLAAALSLGWLTGGYQMARGAHFLSHTVATMFIAWPLVTLLAYLFRVHCAAPRTFDDQRYRQRSASYDRNSHPQFACSGQRGCPERPHASHPLSFAVTNRRRRDEELMSEQPNPVNFKKLPGSKWTAAQPQNREKHFLVLGWELDEGGQPTDRIEIEAVLTRRVQLLPWRALRDPQHWRIGWR